MDHDPRVGQRDPRPLLAGHQQERAHGGRHAQAKGDYRAADVLHGVVDREAGGHHAARRVNVHLDLFLRVLGLQVQQLGADQRRHAVLDGARQEDDPVFQETGEDVVSALASARLFDDHRHEAQRGGDGVTHREGVLLGIFGEPADGSSLSRYRVPKAKAQGDLRPRRRFGLIPPAAPAW